MEDLEKELLKKCKVCGMPSFAKGQIKWYPNGVMAAPKAKGLRYIALREEELRNLYSKLEERIGISLELLIRNAKEIITVFFIDYFISPSQKIILKIARRFKAFREKSLKAATKTMVFWGIFESFEFEKEKAKIVIRNPIYLPLIIGGVAGSFQYSFGCKSTGIDYEKKGDILTVTVWPEKKELEVKKYIPKPIPVSKIKILPGNIPYQYCPECGALKEIFESFSIEFKNENIIDMKANKRVIIMTAHCHNAILKAIEGQLGKEISVMAMEIEKEYTKNNFDTRDLKGTEEDYKKLFIPFYFGIMGWGNATKVTKEDKILTVRIDNPFNETILAGVVGGIYEAIEKIEAQVRWTPNNEGYTVITVSPKQ